MSDGCYIREVARVGCPRPLVRADLSVRLWPPTELVWVSRSGVPDECQWIESKATNAASSSSGSESPAALDAPCPLVSYYSSVPLSNLAVGLSLHS
jgi:hypothetical protein